MDRRQFLKASAGLAALAGLSSTRAFAQGVDIPVGVIYPMSGPSAQVGVDGRHALETALEIINGDYDLPLPGAKGAGIGGLNGAKIRLVVADHQGDPQKGRAEAERLITQDKVVTVIGAFHSSVSTTASAVCERYGVPYIAADSSSPSLHRRNLKYFFRPSAHDEMFSTAMFDFLDAERAAGRKAETVGIFYEDTIFGTDSANVQRKLANERGYKIVCDIKYKANSPSLTSEAQQIKSADPDVFLPSSYTTDAILLMKAFGEIGYKPRNIVAQAAGFSDKATFEAVGDKLEGMISRASFSLDLAAKRPFIGTVNDMFKARANRDLNDNTSRQLMALLILADALERAKAVDGAKIRDALAATNIPGDHTIMPWKYVRFGADGQNDGAEPVLIQYLGGKFVTVYPKNVALQSARWN